MKFGFIEEINSDLLEKEYNEYLTLDAHEIQARMLMEMRIQSYMLDEIDSRLESVEDEIETIRSRI